MRRTFMLRVFLVALMASLLVRPALAGPNEDGYLILHANPGLPFTSEPPWAGSSELYDCEMAVTQVEGNGEGIYLFVMAVFSDFSRPRIAGFTFGVEYTTPMIDLSGGPIGENTVEIKDQGWPRSGTGTTVAYATDPSGRQIIKEDRVTELYWFAGYAVNGASIQLVAHPTKGGTFTSDVVGIENEPDEIRGYGKIGFGTEGFNPCGYGDEEANGGCCDENGRCRIWTQIACEYYGGYGSTYLGDNTTCNPNKCVPGMGACCAGLSCLLLPFDECVDEGGTFMGRGEPCEPTPCNFSRIETTWGNVKKHYTR